MAVSMCRNPSIEKVRPICGIAFCRTKWHRRSEMSFYAARNGIDDRKCRFMPHEMASTIGNAVLCRTKWHRRSEMPFYVARKTTSTIVYATFIHEKRPSPEGHHPFDPRKHPQQPSNAASSYRMLFNLRTVLYLCLRIRKDEGGAWKNLLISDNKGLTHVERIR